MISIDIPQWAEELRKELERNQEELREEVKDNRENIITNRKLITHNTIDIAVNKQEIIDLTISLDGQIAVIEDDILVLKHNDTELQLQLSKLKDDFDVLKHDLSALNLTTLDGINILNDDVSLIQDDIKALQNKVDELDVHDSVLNTAFDNLEYDLKILQYKFDDLSATTTQLKSTSYNHGIRLNHLDIVVSDLRIDVNYLEERVIKLNQTDKALENIIRNLTEKFNQLTHDLNAVSEKSDQGEVVLLILINDLISEIRTDLQELSDRVDSSDAALQLAINKVHADLTNLEADLEAIAKRTTNLETSIDSINAKLNSIHIKIEKLEDIDTDLNGKIKNLKTELKKLTDHSNLRDDQSQVLINGLQIQINDLKTEFLRLEQKSDQIDAELRTEIRDAVIILTQLLQKLTARVTENEKSIFDINADLDSIIADIIKLENTDDRLLQIINQFKLDHEKIQTNIEELEAKLIQQGIDQEKALTDLRNNLYQQIGNLKNQINDLRIDITTLPTLKNKLDELQNKLTSLTSRLNEAAIWIVEQGVDCYYKCGSKGGYCSKCRLDGDAGYCCSQTKPDKNGNCPSKALQAMSDISVQTMHQCVRKVTF